MWKKIAEIIFKIIALLVLVEIVFVLKKRAPKKLLSWWRGVNATKVITAESEYLRKHHYPLRIKLFGFVLLFFSLCTMPPFVLIELPRHRILKNKIDIAENYFRNKDYWNALYCYTKLFEEHKYFNRAKTRVAQSCFACSADNEELYHCGLSLLHGQFKDEEIKDLASYLPTKQKRKEFKSLFKDIAET